MPDLASITQIAQENLGALWLIGNEMDVVWQDNDTPEQYVAAYHAVYATVKQADGNRLVQRWCWYSPSNTDYPTGNLADASTSALTPLGNDFKAYLDR